MIFSAKCWLNINKKSLISCNQLIKDFECTRSGNRTNPNFLFIFGCFKSCNLNGHRFSPLKYDFNYIEIAHTNIGINNEFTQQCKLQLVQILTLYIHKIPEYLLNSF